jgi:hypothetical protein
MLAALKVIDGTAGVPGFSFANESTTGLSRISAGVLGFSILGVERMRLTATGPTFTGDQTVTGNLTVTGNTAIGAPTTGNALFVKGPLQIEGLTTSNTITARLAGGGETLAQLGPTGAGTLASMTVGMGALNTALGSYIESLPSGATTIYGLSAAARISIAAAGNVTIAAPSSGTALTVTAASSSFVALLNDIGGGGVSWRNGANTTGYDIGLLAGTGDASAYIYQRANAQLLIGTNNTTRVTIAAAGNVTIAAPSSGAALTVNGLASAVSTRFNSASATDPLQMAISLGGADKGYYGIAGAANNLITGSVQNDFCFRSEGGNMLFSTTSGASVQVKIASNGKSTFSGGALTTNSNIGNSSTAFTVDCNLSNTFYVTMTGNVAAGSMTISNMSDGQTINIVLTQDGTGSRTLGNATGVKWPGGTVGVLSTAAGAIDFLTITQMNGVKYASLAKAFA